MQELIVALTRAANAVATYYEKSAGATLASLAPTHTHEPVPAAEGPAAGIPPLPEKTTKPKKTKPAAAPSALVTPSLGAPAAAAAVVATAAVASAAAVSPVPAPAAAPAYTPEQERESTTELYRVAAAFIQKTPEPDAMEARRTFGMAKMQELFKVETIKDLTHTQRLGFIQWLKAETAKA